MITDNELRLLWDTYLRDGKLSPAEWQHLRLLFLDPRYKGLLEELLTELYETQPEKANSNAPSFPEAYAEVWEKLEAESNTSASPVLPLHRRGWWRYAAAAALLGAICLTFFFWWPRPSSGLTAKLPQNVDTTIQPGGDRATLTLADGSVILLTEAADGTLASQGSSRVIKRSNGEIVYEGGGSENSAPLYNTVSTPRGGKFRLSLPDGSKVWLNAASSLRYPTSFTGSTRDVVLTGEAYFEIAHNPAQPFHVQANDMQVEVLGTHFNVMAYDNEAGLATTLLEGSVRVRTPRQQMQLKPGEQALEEGGAMSLRHDVNVQQVVAWKNDYFQFNGDGLDRLMRQLERWYDVTVVYEGAVPQKSFGGKVSRSSPLTDVLKALELAGVKFRMEGRKIIVADMNQK